MLKNGDSAIVCAAKHDHHDIVEVLINSAADINFEDKVRQLAYLTCWVFALPLIWFVHVLKDGVSAIILAAVDGDEEAVKILIDSGADVNLKNKVSYYVNCHEYRTDASKS